MRDRDSSGLVLFVLIISAIATWLEGFMMRLVRIGASLDNGRIFPGLVLLVRIIAGITSAS